MGLTCTNLRHVTYCGAGHVRLTFEVTKNICVISNPMTLTNAVRQYPDLCENPEFARIAAHCIDNVQV